MAPGDRLARMVRDWVPRWWRGEGGWAGRGMDLLLWPAEGLFRLGVGVRNRAFDAGLLATERAPIPVVSVGNIGVGGAGKTPLTAWLAARLLQQGLRPAVVLRGYGADEVLVHQEVNPSVPVFTAARRIEAVREAAREGCDIAVLDDAFQHRRIARDLDVVLLGVDAWRGAPRLLPRGGWREGLGALRRADLVVLTRKAAPEAAARALEDELKGEVDPRRLVRCRMAPAGLERVDASGAAEDRVGLEALAGREVLAVSSLADPRPFVRHLEEAGARVELAAFPDHHDFSSGEVTELVRRAASRPLLMTRKEAVKLRPLLPPGVDAWMLPQSVVIESNQEALDAALQGIGRR